MVASFYLFGLALLYIPLSNAGNQPNILFLMCDSMDGRNMDPTAGQYPLMNMPNLRNLASRGSIMTRHYTSSPQCVPGRTALFSGRRTDEQKGFNNGMGWAMLSNGSSTDPQCKKDYNQQTCQRWGKLQALNYTLYDALTSIGYDVYLFGKVDVGAGIIEMPNEGNATVNGFHGGPSIVITTRSANIQRATKGVPKANENDNNVHHEDFLIVDNCTAKLHEIKQSNTNKPWFMYCSINIPHPPYNTNATWLSSVSDNVPLPPWLAEDKFHPADSYQSISKNVWGNFSDDDINSVRRTYYGMNVETDWLLGNVLNTSYSLGWNESNTIIIFTSDHGDMNMEHRQQLKNSMYEGSARIPLFFAGPNIKKSNIIRNITASIDILPTLIEMGGSTPPSFLSGYSLNSMLYDNDKYNDNVIHPNYVTSQYHSNMGNTGSFMVRKDKWKYIQFGHYLKTFENYQPQLFDLENDPNEINDVSLQNQDIVQEMESILSSQFNYEYIDCIAKQNDFMIFEQFIWTSNQTKLYEKMQKSYKGFNQTDMETIINWRDQMLNATQTECEQHAIKWLRPITDQERANLYGD